MAHRHPRTWIECFRYPFPDTWPSHSDNCMLVDVSRGSEEWQRAANMLTASVTDASLVQLQRCVSASGCMWNAELTPPCTVCSVQNRHLWKRYHHEKRLWSDALGEANVNEQLLWHGTSGLSPGVICKGLDGFDFRMVGVVIACSCAAHVSPVSDSS